MSKNNRNSLKSIPWYHWHHVIISTGIVGFIPGARGTYGAFIALLVWIWLYLHLSPIMLCIASILLVIVSLFVGVWTDNVMERYWGPDPRTVIIDEFFGTWVAVLAALFHSGPHYIPISLATIAFILFRLIDMTKPLGCRWLDKNIHGGWGCMLDDALAGFYALILTLVIRNVEILEWFYDTKFGANLLALID